MVLRGLLVVDFTRYLPGSFASRELLRLGARVVRVEAPGGDPLRSVAPGWDAALNSGKESVVWDLGREPGLGPALAARADVVLEGFRPGVADRLGFGASAVPDSVVYCSITGFTGGLACYRMYETADGRFLTVTAVEPKFWQRLCELIVCPEIVERHYAQDQEALAAELATAFRSRPLSAWLDLFEGEDVMAGPVATLVEASEWLGEPVGTGSAPALGEHTERWRAELASFEG